MGMAVSYSEFMRPDEAPPKPGQITYSGYVKGDRPDGTYWMSQIRKGVEYRKKVAFEDKWDLFRRYYRGMYPTGTLPYNIMFKMVRTLVPRVYFRNPSVSVMPSQPGDDNAVFAQILERIDNKLIRQMKVKEAIKQMTQNAFMFGTGIGKLGYGAEFTPTPDYLDAAAPTSGGKHDFRVEYNDLVLPNMPWFLSVHPGQFIVPVGTTDLHSARWVGHWVRRHIDDVKDDPRLEHTSDINVSKMYGSEMIRAERPREEGLVDLVEIRDKKTGIVFIIAPYHHSKILYQGHDEMMDRGHFPYFPLVFNQDDLWFWGIPDAQILEPQQRELNEIRTVMMKHRRISLIKILAKREHLSPDEVQKLSGEEVGPVIMLEEEGNVADVKVMESANLPQGLITMDALVERDVQEILGLGANQFGEYAPGSADRSATEANIVNQATQIRMDERRDTVADLIVDVMKQTHDVIFSRWDGSDEQVVDLIGPGGVPVWVKFRPQELQKGGYNVSIDPDSTLPETKQVREAKAVQVYQMLSQNPLINKQKLTQYLLRELHGAEYDDMMLNPQEQQQQQQEQMKTALTMMQYKELMKGTGTSARGPGRVSQVGGPPRAA